MNLELDHVFILVEPGAHVADLLVQLGLKESFRRDHPGQGTSNRRFEFENGMLELLFMRDEGEALNGPGHKLGFSQRIRQLFRETDKGKHDGEVSPFGIVFSKKDPLDLRPPFVGWTYQPDYFDEPKPFHVGANSNNLTESLCICAPFIAHQPSKPIELSEEKKLTTHESFQSIDHVTIYTPSKYLSEVLQTANGVRRLSIKKGNEHLMEISFDKKVCGLSNDFRPYIPLIIHY